MTDLLAKYAAKLVASGLCEPGEPLFAALDETLEFSRAGDIRQPLAEAVFAGLNISALLLARSAGVYQAVIRSLAARALETSDPNTTPSITPGDCETRTFLHDLPVVSGLAAPGIIQALKGRKGCVVLDETTDEATLVSLGTVSPEQAYVTFSSMCFACFVAYFAEYLADLRAGALSAARRAEFAAIKAQLTPGPTQAPTLLRGPFADEATARQALIEAGRHTVEFGLVDSYFGNISYRLRGTGGGADTILISQTGSSLDELGPCLDPCPMDGSSCAGLTASSEYSAHKAVYEGGPDRAILHGHPRFSVILSLDCAEADCPERGQCHRACPKARAVCGLPDACAIPIVPGEVGTGPYGLCNTLPPAMQGKRGVIVYGHGLFTLGAVDFTDAFQTLLNVESFSRDEYFRRVAELGG